MESPSIKWLRDQVNGFEFDKVGAQDKENILKKAIRLMRKTSYPPSCCLGKVCMRYETKMRRSFFNPLYINWLLIN